MESKPAEEESPFVAAEDPEIQKALMEAIPENMREAILKMIEETVQ